MPLNDPSAALQATFIAVLKDCGSPAANRFYDSVPKGAKFPYGVLGNVQVISELIPDFSGAEVYVTLDIWSREPGKTEAQAIGKAAIAALDDTDISGANVTIKSCLLNDARYILDPDGLTTHGILTFHILTD